MSDEFDPAAERGVASLIDALQSGRLDRRAFVRRALIAGLALPSIGALLSACKGGDKAPEAGGAPSTGTQAAGAEAAKADDKLEGELHIYNWSDYIAEDTVKNFEKEFGVKVTYDTYESNEELIAKLQAGGGGYDLVVPSGYAVMVLSQLGLMQKLDRSKIKNLGNISPIFRGASFDPQNEYTVPWQWGTTGIAYRKDLVTSPPDSWAVFHDAQYKGKMTQMDDMRDVIGCWLKYRGKSLNSTDPAELATAKTDAITAKALLKSYLSAPVKAQLIAGDVWIAQLWNGDTAQAKAENDQIAYVMPKEGGAIWADSMVIPKNAPHPKAAHAFLDYILRPEVGASISNHTGYGTPNEPASKLLERPVPFPDPAELAKLEYQKDLAEATAAWDQIWTEIKSA
ncbi:MAG: spermidine/putrescine ABC transporter substrate-binding protein [Myxococcales bacterium]|nr:spermidine/putrescine ABC transporter substrate-binding protein [Myxococcales bacterium]MCB9553956.1 spermidine/putrescine ABC transporter substrate-binding protein [Myxococcales bacterium]